MTSRSQRRAIYQRKLARQTEETIKDLEFMIVADKRQKNGDRFLKKHPRKKR